MVELIGNRPGPSQVDLAESPDFAETRNELESLLLAEQHRLGDPYRRCDQPEGTSSIVHEMSDSV